MKSRLRDLKKKIADPVKKLTAETVVLASEAAEAASPHIKEAVHASTEVVSEGFQGQRYRVSAAVGTGLVFGTLGFVGGLALPLISPITTMLWGLIGGAIVGATQAQQPVQVVLANGTADAEG